MLDFLALDKIYKLVLLLGYLFIIWMHLKTNNLMTAYGLIAMHIILIIESEYTYLILHL